MITKKHSFFAYLSLCVGFIKADSSIVRFSNQSPQDVKVSLIDIGDKTGTILQKNLENGAIVVEAGKSVDLLEMPRGWGSSEDLARFSILTMKNEFIAEIQEKVEHEAFDSDVFAAIIIPGTAPEWAEFDTDKDTSSKTVTVGTTIFTIRQHFSDDNPVFVLTSQSALGSKCTTPSKRPGIITEKGCIHSCTTKYDALGLEGEFTDPSTGKPQCFVYEQEESENGTFKEGILDVQDLFMPLCRTKKGRVGYLENEECKSYCVTEDGYNGTISSDGKTCIPFGGEVAKTTPAAKTKAASAATGRTRTRSAGPRTRGSGSSRTR